VFPCSAIDLGNQYGDYEGLVSFAGVSHPVWTDSRRNQQPSSGCSTNELMEEVFTAPIRQSEYRNQQLAALSQRNISAIPPRYWGSIFSVGMAHEC
jgi:hypothetical protein